MEQESTRISLVERWDSLWGSISADYGGHSLSEIVGYFGIALIIASLGLYAWRNSRGRSGGGFSPIFYATILGAALSAPNMIIPFFLRVLEFLISAVIGIGIRITG